MQDTVREWRKLVDYPNYSVSNYGEVRNDTTGGLLHPWTGKVGYKMVKLNDNGKWQNKTVHRLVALTFIPNPQNKATVNHKDGDKTNNRLDNLEWATYSENNYHAYNVLDSGRVRRVEQSKRQKGVPHSKEWSMKIGKARAIKVRRIEDGKIFNSMREAKEYMGVSSAGHICSACRGKRNIAHGYHWEYYKEV